MEGTIVIKIGKMTNSILLQDLTHDQLGNLIDDKLKHRLEQLKKHLDDKNANDALLSRDEASLFLKIDQSTLYHWQKAGKVKAYGIGSRRYFKRTELIDALTPLKK